MSNQDEHQLQKRRGRRALHDEALMPEGITKKQNEILKTLAADRGVSLAQIKREIIDDYLSQFGFTHEDQGLV